jgi:RND family efflux transporter MFP subunit
VATANQPLLTVMDTSKLIAKGHLSQTEAVQLKAGNAAEIKVAGVEEAIAGRVTLISPALDPGSTTLEVWVEAIKPNAAMRPGITVQVKIQAKTDKSVVVVPVSAVFKNADGDGEYVLVAGADNKAHFATVHIGIRNAESAEIVSGIKEGDPVITSGGYAIPDGTKIKIENSTGSGKEGGAAGKTDDKGKE